jgi:D-alanyl-D-alanine endopeptidase (penicillin-binding protein 7)
MTLSTPNILIYSVQMLVLIGAAAIGAAIFRLPLARARLAYWRVVVVACLILPWVSALVSVPPAFVGPYPISRIAFGITTETGSGSSPFTRSIPLLLLLGAVARGAWLTLGLLRLRHLRQHSTPASLGPDVDRLKHATAPSTELRWHDGVTQPVTFGIRRPVVLLPRRLLDLPTDAQHAVLCHELLHVARHDWLWMAIEQAVQTVLWFHPAMWWALGEVHLSREQAVDERVIRMTGKRQPYLRALLTFAEGPAPALAAPFIQRGHLMSRIREISRDSTGSPLRLALLGAPLIVVTLGAGLGAISTLPLQGRESQPTVYEPGNGVLLPSVIREVRPQYTEEAKQAHLEGTVLLDCVVASNGTPRDIIVTGSLDAVYGLDQAAIEALEQWRFKPGTKDGKAVDVHVHVEMTFTLK